MSGTEYLLDTNIVIGLLKADAAVLAVLEEYPEALEHCAVSQITRMELLGFPGLEDSDEQAIREHRLVISQEKIGARRFFATP